MYTYHEVRARGRAEEQDIAHTSRGGELRDVHWSPFRLFEHIIISRLALFGWGGSVVREYSEEAEQK